MPCARRASSSCFSPLLLKSSQTTNILTYTQRPEAAINLSDTILNQLPVLSSSQNGIPNSVRRDPSCRRQVFASSAVSCCQITTSANLCCVAVTQHPPSMVLSCSNLRVLIWPSTSATPILTTFVAPQSPVSSPRSASNLMTTGRSRSSTLYSTGATP